MIRSQKVKKSSHPHTSSHVPIILIGNKVDMVEQEVSLLEGKEMARTLGCRFVEASAKDDGNIEESFPTIMQQLQKPCKEKVLLDDLIDSLPKWYNLVGKLESEISLSQVELVKENTSALVPVHAMNVATEQPGAKKALPALQLFRVKLSTLLEPHQRSFPGIKLSTLQLPRLMQRQRSFPGINSCQPPSRTQSLSVSPKQKASSVDYDISQTSEHPGRSVLGGNYNFLVQKAFRDIIEFLSKLGRKIRGMRLAEIMARVAIDIGDNYIGGEIGGSEIKDNEGMPTAEKVGKMDIVQEVKKALNECQRLCEDAAFEVIQYGESRGKIQEMKNEFVRVIETAAKLR